MIHIVGRVGMMGRRRRHPSQSQNGQHEKSDWRYHRRPSFHGVGIHFELRKRRLVFWKAILFANPRSRFSSKMTLLSRCRAVVEASGKMAEPPALSCPSFATT